MRIFVRTKLRAKKTSVQKNAEYHYTVEVSEVPGGGRANLAVLLALSEYFNIPKERMNLESGETSNNKVYTIETKRVLDVEPAI